MYFPKSQIQSNLYTNGDEFIVVSTGKPYMGYYWKVSSGKYFTGKTPQAKPNDELRLISTQPSLPSKNTSNLIVDNHSPNSTLDPRYNIEYEEVFKYVNLRGLDINDLPVKINPPYYFPRPTEGDYELGAFTRYFIKKANETKYIEINKDVYNKFINKNPLYDFKLYIPFTIEWTLKGKTEEEIIKTNLSIVTEVSRKLKLRGLPQYFSNYSQFFRIG